MNQKSSKPTAFFNRFRTSVEGIDLPEQFNYPMCYDPHPIAEIAAMELQDYLKTQSDWEHNFGLEEGKDGLVIGKMFGVLVVKNQENELGYICAFSGKLAGHNQHEKFVPPVFDILLEDGFFKKGEAIVSEINQRIEALEKSSEFIDAIKKLDDAKTNSLIEIEAQKRFNKEQKKARDHQRKEFEQQYTGEALLSKLLELNKQSIHESYRLKDLAREWKDRIAQLELKLNHIKQEIDVLKEERKTRSSRLQNEIFEQYYFFNKNLEKRSLGDIFKNTPEGRPTAGAGECAAPKLLQFAFLHHLEPIAMAEFWWGQSPKSEIRIHGHYYPACKGKCEPILGHMLVGMNVEKNPMLNNPAEGKELEIVWEDETVVVVNKPAEFLSVPGKNITDSVLERLKALYPEATGPILVHRLDMSTSGILIAGKTEEAYKHLQRQFIKRSIKKRYVALLNGTIEQDEGMIDLPLRVDLNDRPRQMVCYEYGKPARTKWKVIERVDGKTKVQFYPITGRTHQLRVHAAHPLGLNTPIVGDDLYGKRADRLHLHAEWIEFYHPITNKITSVRVAADF